MDFTVNGTAVLVTGAAMGMGRLFAERALAEGAATVVLWDINAQALEKTRAELQAAGGQVHAQVVDVSDLNQIEQAAGEVLERFGAPQLLINNAGVVRGNKYFWEHDNVRDTRFTMAINALAPMYVLRAFVDEMIARERPARVINLASAAGMASNPRMSVYAASKWAMLGWSDSVRLELEQAGHAHVGVTTVCPSYVDTGMFAGAKGPLFTPILKPERVIEASWRAMKKKKPFVILPRTVYLARLFKGLLPTRVFDFVLGRVFGVYRSMDDFKGR